MASRSEDENSFDGDEWLPNEAMKVIQMEKDVNPALTDETLTERYLINASPSAALAVAHLSKHSPDPRVRLAASTYILDKVIGRNNVGLLSKASANGKSPVEALLDSIEVIANTSIN